MNDTFLSLRGLRLEFVAFFVISNCLAAVCARKGIRDEVVVDTEAAASLHSSSSSKGAGIL